MENKIEVNVSEGTKELVIRKGEAIPHYDQKKINISGVISSPRLFWEKRNKEHEKLSCHVLYTLGNNPSIELILEEHDHFSGKVTGELKVNPLVSSFGINTGKEYSIEQMKKFLRMNRAYFIDREANMALLGNLQKFNASVNMEIENHDSNRGDFSHKISQKVKAEFPLDFVLKLSPYVGSKEIPIKCEICFSISNGNTTIWLESPDLQELLINEKLIVIQEELKAFEDLVCIEY